MIKIIKKNKEKQKEKLELRALDLMLLGVIVNPSSLTDKVINAMKEC